MIDHHRSFLGRSLAGTVLRSKMVRNLTELKVLVYDFATASQRLDIDAETLDLDTTQPPGALSTGLNQCCCLPSQTAARMPKSSVSLQSCDT